jgi:hypothetical protein
MGLWFGRRLSAGSTLSCKRSGIHLLDLCEHLVGVARNFHRLEDIPDDALLVNDERRPIRVAVRIRKDAERGADAAVRICEQRQLEIVRSSELAV